MLAAIKKQLFLIKQKLQLRGGSYTRTPIFTKVIVQRTLPVNLNSADAVLFEREIKKELNAAAAYELDKALVTSEGFIYSNNILIPEAAQGKVSDGFYGQVLWSRRTKHAGNAKYLVVFNKFSAAYYHWVAEVLPKLIWFKTNNDIHEYTLLLPANHKQTFVEEYLKGLGYNKVEYFNSDENVIVNRATYITEFSQTGNIRPEAAASIRDNYSVAGEANKMVYISRAKAPKRKVINEAALVAVLKANGVDTVYTDNMPVREQIELFSKCKLLIAIHGAGLTNMLFMPTGTKVIELRLRGDNTNNCYFSLASALGLHYYYSLCESSDTMKSTQDADFVVDIEDITSILKEISGSTTT